jgi:hypothetical protein
MFSWNIPASNQFAERTDAYLNIIATWDGNSFYNDGTPLVYVDLINPSLYTCVRVKDWFEAEGQIKQVATKHFADIAREERLNQARAVLAIENDPVLSRLEQAAY